MALTYSSMLELQTNLIEFDLLNSVSNKNFSSDSIDRDKPSLIMFICNHCPYVIHYHDEIVRLEKDYAESINIIAISIQLLILKIRIGFIRAASNSPTTTAFTPYKPDCI